MSDHVPTDPISFAGMCDAIWQGAEYILYEQQRDEIREDERRLRKNRAVALKLGLGERCNGFQHPGDNDTKICNTCGAITTFYGSHSSLPDLLSPSGADLLMTALWERAVTVIIDPVTLRVVLTKDDKRSVGVVKNNETKPALLDAAFKLPGDDHE